MLKAITIDIPPLKFHGDLEFSSGLNVITGESGTGKSLILEAISHVFGRKTNRFSKLERYTISAIVELSEDIISRLISLGLEVKDKEVSIFINKRERATYRINGVLLSWATAYSIFNDVISVVSVDERGYLRKNSIRLELLDRFVDPLLKKKLMSLYDRYVSLNQYLEELKYNLSLLEERYRSLQELSRELSDVVSYIDKYEDLLSLSEKLKRAEKVLSISTHVKELLKDSDNSVWNVVYKAEGYLEEIGIDSNMDCVFDVISEIMEKLDDTTKEYQDMSLSLDEIENIIWKIQKLMRKYDTDIDGIRKIVSEIDEVFKEITAKKNEINKIEREIDDIKIQYNNVALELSSERKRAVEKINTYLQRYSRKLVGGNVYVLLETQKAISPTGYDSVEFVFKINEEKLVPVYEIASSGELSRILLLLYTLLPPSQKILLFDEIDSGTSGNVASTIGWFLKKLSSSVQIITSTHSQFVAAAADSHFIVEDVSFGKEVKIIEGKLRLKEIARLIDGGSNRAYSIARELINSYKRGDKYG